MPTPNLGLGWSGPFGAPAPRKKKKPKGAEPAAPTGITSGGERWNYVGSPAYKPKHMSPLDFEPGMERDDLSTQTKKVASAFHAATGLFPRSTLSAAVLNSGYIRPDITVAELTGWFRAALGVAGGAYNKDEIVAAQEALREYVPDWQALAAFKPLTPEDFYRGIGTVDVQPYVSTKLTQPDKSHISRALRFVGSENEQALNIIGRKQLGVFGLSQLPINGQLEGKIVHSASAYKDARAGGRAALLLPYLSSYRNPTEFLRLRNRYWGKTAAGRATPEDGSLRTVVVDGEVIRTLPAGEVVRGLQQQLKDQLHDAAYLNGVVGETKTPGRSIQQLLAVGTPEADLPTIPLLGDSKVKVKPDSRLLAMSNAIKPTGIWDEASQQAYAQQMVLHNYPIAAAFQNSPDPEKKKMAENALQVLIQLGVPGIKPGTDLQTMLAQQIGADTYEARAALKEMFVGMWLSSLGPGQTAGARLAEFYDAFGMNWATPAVLEAHTQASQEAGQSVIEKIMSVPTKAAKFAWKYGSLPVKIPLNISLEVLSAGHGREVKRATLYPVERAVLGAYHWGSGEFGAAYTAVHKELSRIVSTTELYASNYRAQTASLDEKRAAASSGLGLAAWERQNAGVLEGVADHIATVPSVLGSVVGSAAKSLFTWDTDSLDNAMGALQGAYSEAGTPELGTGFRALLATYKFDASQYPTLSAFGDLGEMMVIDTAIGKALMGASRIPAIRAQIRSTTQMLPWVDDGAKLIAQARTIANIRGLFPKLLDKTNYAKLQALAHIAARYDFDVRGEEIAAMKVEREAAAIRAARAKSAADAATVHAAEKGITSEMLTRMAETEKARALQSHYDGEQADMEKILSEAEADLAKDRAGVAGEDPALQTKFGDWIDVPASLIAQSGGKAGVELTLVGKVSAEAMRDLAHQQIKHILRTEGIAPDAAVIKERAKMAWMTLEGDHPILSRMLPRIILRGGNMTGPRGQFLASSQGDTFIQWIMRAAGVSENRINAQLTRYLHVWNSTIDIDDEEREYALHVIMAEAEKVAVKTMKDKGTWDGAEKWMREMRRKADQPTWLRAYLLNRKGEETSTVAKLDEDSPIFAEIQRSRDREEKIQGQIDVARREIEDADVRIAEATAAAERAERARREAGAMVGKAGKAMPKAHLSKPKTQVELRRIRRTVQGQRDALGAKSKAGARPFGLKDVATMRAALAKKLEKAREGERLKGDLTTAPATKKHTPGEDELAAAIKQIDDITALEVDPTLSMTTAIKGEFKGVFPKVESLYSIVTGLQELGYKIPADTASAIVNGVGRDLRKEAARNEADRAKALLRAVSDDLVTESEHAEAAVPALLDWLQQVEIQLETAGTKPAWMRELNTDTISDMLEANWERDGENILRQAFKDGTLRKNMPNDVLNAITWQLQAQADLAAIQTFALRVAEHAHSKGIEGKRMPPFRVPDKDIIHILGSTDELSVARAAELVGKAAPSLAKLEAEAERLGIWTKHFEKNRKHYEDELGELTRIDADTKTWAHANGVPTLHRSSKEIWSDVHTVAKAKRDAAAKELTAAHKIRGAARSTVATRQKQAERWGAQVEKIRREIVNRESFGMEHPAQPAFLGQLAKYYMPGHDYDLLLKYNAGPLARKIEEINRHQVWPGVSIDTMTQAYKNIVLAKLGTMIRINLGDEYLRPIAEGVNPWRYSEHLRGRFEKLKEDGVVPADMSANDLSSLTDNCVARSHIKYSATDGPDYIAATHQFAAIVRADPMTKAYVKAMKGNDPVPRAAAREAMLKEANENPAVQTFLARTYRHQENQTEAWVDALLDFYESIDDADMGGVYFHGAELTVDMLKGKDIDKMPVITGRLHRERSPHFLSRAAMGQDKFHEMLYGTLDAMSNDLKARLWARRYDDSMAILAKTRRDLSERATSRMAAHAATDYVDDTLYNAAATMGESLFRNVILFLPAYRQFYAYWGKVMAENPFLFGPILKDLQQMPDVVNLDEDTPLVGGLIGAVNDVIGGLGGGEDFKARFTINPKSAIFLTGGASGSEENFIIQNLPGGGPIFTMPAAAMQEAFPKTFAGLYRVPFLSFSRPGQPMNRVFDRLFYGATGQDMPWPAGSKPETRERMVLNLVRMQYTEYYRRLQNAATPEERALLEQILPKPDVERAAHELRALEGVSGLINFFSPFNVKVTNPDLATRMESERAYLDLMSKLNDIGWSPTGKLGSVAEDQAKELLKLRDDLLKKDPFYAKVVEYFASDDAKQQQMLKADESLVPWVVGSYTYDLESNTPLTTGEFYDQWTDPRSLIKPPEMQARIEKKLAVVEGQRMGVVLEAEYEKRWAIFEAAALEKRYIKGTSSYIKFQREFEFGVGAWAGKGLLDISTPTSELPDLWRQKLTSGEEKYVKLKDLFDDPGELQRSINPDIPDDMPSMGEGTVAFEAYLMRLPYGQAFLEQTRNFPTFIRKNMERTAKLRADYFDIAKMRKYHFTEYDWQTLGIPVSKKVLATQDKLNRIYEVYEAKLDALGVTSMSKEGRPLRAAMIADQRKLIDADAETKRVLGGGVAWRLRTSGFTNETIYKPGDWLALRDKDEIPDNDIAHKITAIEWKAYDAMHKEWLHWDGKRYPTLKSFLDHWQPQLSPAMRQNMDELVRAWTWVQVLGAADSGRRALRDSYNDRTGANGFSPSSKIGKAVKGWLERLALDYAGQRKMQGKVWYVSRGQNPSFWDEWQALNGSGGLANKLIDWTY